MKYVLRTATAIAFSAFTALAAGAPAAPAGHAQSLPSPSANVSVFATGLNNPRGLKFGPDGNLYVAEAGPGGNASTVGICPQVPGLGPYLGSTTGGRISRISSNGTRTTVTDTLPSSKTTGGSGGFVLGAADVAFVGSTLYALVSGGGCSHGVTALPNGIVRVNPDGTWKMIADLSAILMANPVANPDPEDFEPDGTWYSMVYANGALYAIEPNHGELDRIDPVTGQISRVVDISATFGHIVPTALAFYNGAFYVGNLSTFPVRTGSAEILQITPSGAVSVYATGLSAVLGLTFDPQGRMYALETSNVPNGPAPGTGDVVSVSPAGGVQLIASNLNFPTGMTYGPDGQLYVSEMGFGAPPGAGQVVRISLPPIPAALQCNPDQTVAVSTAAPPAPATLPGATCSPVSAAVASLYPGTTASVFLCGTVTAYTAPTAATNGSITINGAVIPISAGFAPSGLAVGTTVRVGFLIPGGQLFSIGPGTCQNTGGGSS